MKIHAKQLNQKIQDLLDGNNSNGYCYNDDYEYHNSGTIEMTEQDLDDYEILKYCKRIKTESYISIMREQRAFLDSLTDKQRQEFKDAIIQAHENNNL